jgi:hypothetical protein
MLTTWSGRDVFGSKGKFVPVRKNQIPILEIAAYGKYVVRCGPSVRRAKMDESPSHPNPRSMEKGET